MGYSIFRLKLEWTGSHYVNRLELGDDSMNAPVDIRFIDYPGWIENVHSVFFDVNGRDSYSPSNTGGLITTSDTGDLVFFDPSNAVGRTLSQLYAGGGGDSLWEDTGSYVQLTTPKDVSLKNHSIKDVFNIYAYDSGSTDDNFSILSNTGVLGFNIKFTDNNPSAIDMYADLNMHSHKLTGLGDIDMGGHDITDLNMMKASATNGIEIRDSSNVQAAHLGGSIGSTDYALICDMYGINLGEQSIDNVYRISGIASTDLYFYDDIAGEKTLSELVSDELWEEFDSTSICPKNYDNIYVKKISFDFSGDDACKIWKDGDNLMFMDGYNPSGVSLSGLIGGGNGLWEEVSSTTIRPKDHDIIQGRNGYDLTIKPASGGILYLG